MIIRALALAIVMLSAAAHAAGSLHTADGRTREWREHAPSNAKGALPVVIVLHGGGGNAEQMEKSSGFDAAADAHGFLAIYADGTGHSHFHTWNATKDCCGYAMKERVDDVAFLVGLVDEIAKSHAIDKKRVFLVGHSNGAVMAERALCERPDVFAGAVVVSSPGLGGACVPKEPRAVLVVHGTADKCASYAPAAKCGGCWERAVGAMFGVDADPKGFACDGAVAITDRWRAPTAASSDVVTRAVGPASCSRSAHAKATVELCTINGGGHAFPGAIIDCKRGRRACDAYLDEVGEPAKLDLAELASSFLLSP
jgi:polyhydroxybutyrate depolymerase